MKSANALSGLIPLKSVPLTGLVWILKQTANKIYFMIYTWTVCANVGSDNNSRKLYADWEEFNCLWKTFASSEGPSFGYYKLAAQSG
jgi:hypothetical protein